MNIVSSFHRVFDKAAILTSVDASDTAVKRAHLLKQVDTARKLRIPLLDACAVVGITRSTYYRWKQAMQRGGLHALRDGRKDNTRKRVGPAQRVIRVRVEQLRSEFPYGKNKIAVLLAREGFNVSVSTVGRVLSKLLHRGAIRPIAYTRKQGRAYRQAAKRTHAKRLRRKNTSTIPGSRIQVDTLHEYSLGKRRAHFSAIDPVTKLCAASISSNATSAAAKRFLQHLITIYPYPVTGIQVDNGSEYMGHFERACKELGITLFTIPPRSPKWNADVERLQRTFREEHYAYEPPVLSIDDANHYLQRFVHHYNHHRPHASLKYQTPMQYTEGVGISINRPKLPEPLQALEHGAGWAV